MKTTLIAAGILSTLSAAQAFRFSPQTQYGILSFSNEFHTDLTDGSSVTVECGYFKAGIANEGRYRMGPPGEEFDLKDSTSGVVEVEKDENRLCLRTNSTVPCIVRSVFAFNQTWSAQYNSFPGGNANFERCFEKNVVAITKNHKACLDTRLAYMCSGAGGRSCGMGFMERNCAQAWRCIESEETTARVIIQG